MGTPRPAITVSNTTLTSLQRVTYTKIAVVLGFAAGFLLSSKLWISTRFYPMDEPEISVVYHDGSVSPLMTVLAESWRMTVLARALVSFRKDGMFLSPVEIVVLGLDLCHIEMT